MGCRASEPEVQNSGDSVVGDDHVVGLEVSVNQTLRVRGHETAARRKVEVGDLPPVSRLLPLVQRHPVDELHRDVQTTVGRTDVVHGHDVGVVESRERSSLAHEPGLPVGLGVAQELEGDLAIELGIVSAVHHAHRSAADQSQDEVAADLCPALEPSARFRMGPLSAVRTGGENRVSVATIRSLVALRDPLFAPHALRDQ